MKWKDKTPNGRSRDVEITYLANNFDLKLLILATAYKARKELKYDLRYFLIKRIKTDGSASNIRHSDRCVLMMISLKIVQRRGTCFF